MVELTFAWLTPERWPDLVDLFGPSGADGGCWCMWWRQTRAASAEQGSEGNKRALKSLVDSGQTIGLLAYQEQYAVGWVSIAPRTSYPSLERSPVLRRIDEQPVWSLVCLFVRDDLRSQGIARQLIEAALAHAAKRGAQIVEAYPTITDGERLPAPAGYMGTPALFESVGFERVAQPSKHRAIYRRWTHRST